MKYFKPHIFQPLLRLVTQFSTFVIWRFLGVPLLSAIPDLETQFGAVPHWRVLRVLLSTVLDLVVPQVGVVSDHASNILTQTCDPGCHICDLVGALLHMLNCKINSTNRGTFSKSAEKNIFIFFLFQGASVMSK